MKKFISITRLNFREATRDKFFFGVVFFFVFYLVFCIFLGKLSVGHSDKVLRNAGLVGIELTSIILIIFSFIFSFFREKDSRILEVYLCNFKSSSCLGGKIAGYILLSLFYLIFSGISYGAILYFFKAYDPACLIALYPIFLKTIIIICFSSLFASLFSTVTLALLSTLFLYLSSEALPTAISIAKNYGDSIQKLVVKILYFILPNMEKLDIKSLAVYGKTPNFNYFLFITVYTVIFILILWLINLFIFKRREY